MARQNQSLDELRLSELTPAILITGGSGLLGLNWAVAVRDRYAITLGLHRNSVTLPGVTSQEIALDSIDDLSRFLEKLRPRCCIHAAGLTDVEACEANPALAHKINVTLAVNVAQACAATGTPLAHISTDHLFGGSEAMLDESHPVLPLNVYGRTKAEAEVGVLTACERALVIRTNFYGWGPTYRRSFSDRIIESLRRGERVTLFEDVFYTPILAETLTVAVHELLDRRASGTFHLTGDERLSKIEFGRKIAAQFGLDDRLIAPGALADLSTPTRRPHDMSLSNAKVRALLGKPLGAVDAQLTRLREQEPLAQTKEIHDL